MVTGSGTTWGQVGAGRQRRQVGAGQQVDLSKLRVTATLSCGSLLTFSDIHNIHCTNYQVLPAGRCRCIPCCKTRLAMCLADLEESCRDATSRALALLQLAGTLPVQEVLRPSLDNPPPYPPPPPPSHPQARPPRRLPRPAQRPATPRPRSAGPGLPNY